SPGTPATATTMPPRNGPTRRASRRSSCAARSGVAQPYRLTMPPVMDIPTLRAALARVPRVPLGNLPTPLEPMPRLGASIGLSDLRVKRDDLTGLALGGNKVRQLEYLVGDAVAQGATAILTGAGPESN